MGNPNVLWYRWGSLRFGVSSAVQALTMSVPQKVNGGSITQFGGLTPDGAQVVTGGKGADQIQIHEWRVREIGGGFPNQFNPDFKIQFEINGAPWYILPFRSRITPPQVIDFSVVASNTIPSPGGDAPLIINGGDDIRIFIQDGPRLNNSDRLVTLQDLWGIKI